MQRRPRGGVDVSRWSLRRALYIRTCATPARCKAVLVPIAIGRVAHQAPVFHGHGFYGDPHRLVVPHDYPFLGIYPYPAPYYGYGYVPPDPACWWNVDHWVGCS